MMLSNKMIWAGNAKISRYSFYWNYTEDELKKFQDLPRDELGVRVLNILYNRNGNFYLVGCQSLGGFSGSPIFFEHEIITHERFYVSPEI